MRKIYVCWLYITTLLNEAGWITQQAVKIIKYTAYLARSGGISGTGGRKYLC